MLGTGTFSGPWRTVPHKIIFVCVGVVIIVVPSPFNREMNIEPGLAGIPRGIWNPSTVGVQTQTARNNSCRTYTYSLWVSFQNPSGQIHSSSFVVDFDPVSLVTK